MLCMCAVAKHTEVPPFLPHAAYRPQTLPQQVQQVPPAPAHARPAKSRGQPIARGRASAERSARSGSCGRSRSRSPIPDAVGATFEASTDEGVPGEILQRASSNEEQVAKKPAEKKVAGKKKGTGGKKKGPGKQKATGGKKGGRKKEKTSRYLGVSFHSLNRKWRTTVYYGASTPSCDNSLVMYTAITLLTRCHWECIHAKLRSTC